MARVSKKQPTKSLRLQWLHGERNQFRGGEVCRLKTAPENSKTRIVVGPPSHEIDTWQCKVWTGPKPWNFHWADIRAEYLVVIEGEKNPTKYDLSDLYPGPSSPMIKKLQAKFKEIAIEKAKTRTSKDIDHELGIYEEEKTLRSDNLKDEKDSIVIEDMDDGIDEEFIDPVQKKRDATIEEE